LYRRPTTHVTLYWWWWRRRRRRKRRAFGKIMLYPTRVISKEMHTLATLRK
jgi:hypothetical protein